MQEARLAEISLTILMENDVDHAFEVHAPAPFLQPSSSREAFCSARTDFSPTSRLNSISRGTALKSILELTRRVATK
jgi:hypothetical protein